MNELVRQYGAKADFFYIYTIDAHPKQDPSPYTGKVWEFSYSKYRQPKTYDARVQLAQEHISHGGVDNRIVLLVDDLRPENVTNGGDNPVWCIWGPDPNPGFIITPDRRVVFSQHWFKSDDIERELKKILATPMMTLTLTAGRCHSIFADVDDNWCASSCAIGYCPTDLCQCGSIAV